MSVARFAPYALCIALGLGLGSVVAGQPFRPSPTRAAVVAEGDAERRSSLTRADVESVVRQELARGRGVRAPDGVSVAAPANEAAAEPAAEPPIEIIQQAERATLVLDRALARGVWTEEDVQAMHEQIDGLPAAQAVPIVTRMADAVNRGALELTTRGLPL